MTQTSTNPLRAPHTPPISIRRTPRHHQSSPKPTFHPRSRPVPPSPAEPNQGRPYVHVDAQDPGNPPSPPPPDPEHPPLTPTTIRDPDLLRATLQGRALSTPLGCYCLQETWTKLTVKALRDLTTPGNGLHEAIVDLVLWRARQHTQGQHVWIPPIEWIQALTHNTDTNLEGPYAYDQPQRRRTTQRTRTTRSNGNRPPHQPVTPPSAPLASAPQTMTSLPHLQTVTTPCRWSGVQSSRAGTTT